MSRKKTHAANRAPFTREEIIREVRLAALGLASHIAVFGHRQEAPRIAAQYLGVELDDYNFERDGHHQLDSIPIEEHYLYNVVMDAYDHAYQIGDPFENPFNVDERAYEVDGILVGFPRADFNGEPTPLDRLNPQKMRQVLETFRARWSLDRGHDLTVTELALLANMGEATVRTSLSAEGIKTITATEKGEKNQVPHADAVSWLSGRRGFVPTKDRHRSGANHTELMFSLFSAQSLSFEAALQKAIAATGEGEQVLGEQGGNSEDWLKKLLSVDAVMDIDIVALEKLSRTLGAPTPLFVGKAVTALLSRRETPAQQLETLTS
ncbi:hypothetical protein LJR010_006042 [Ensifer adhaerens]|uniref:hypothetical protein n=1 Tax=Ensifer adhaerens TaxID=106592 RepID=UPI000DE44F8B